MTNASLARTIAGRIFCALLFATVLVAPLNAQQAETNEDLEDSVVLFGEALKDVFDRIWVPRSRFRDGPHVRAAFRPVIESARSATVEVRSAGRRVAWGGVVGPHGWVLTKASLLVNSFDSINCRLQDGRDLPARIVGIDRQYDLAMLKLDANDLAYLDLTESQSPETLKRGDLLVSIDKSDVKETPASAAPGQLQAGDWVATVGAGRNPVAIGVVSVAPREIQRRPGFLGVGIGESKDKSGVLVTAVEPRSGAAKAGIIKGDVIRSVDGDLVASPDELRQLIQAKNPGDPVRIALSRQEESDLEQFVLRAVLSGRRFHSRAQYQNNLGGALSERRFGFPSALQHDTVLSPRDCGGPLVDLEGRVVGFNIARAGRTESYALPVEVVREQLFDLMSGRLTPTKLQPQAEPAQEN